MDKLKNFIETHREEFNNISLPENHYERFEKKLTEEKFRKRNKFLLYVASSAACILFIVLFNMNYPPIQTDKNICSAITEFERLKTSYDQEIDKVIKQIKYISEEEQIPGGEELILASELILAGNNRFETTIFPSLPCSNDGLFALEQHYNNSLSSLNILLNHAQKYTNQNNNQ